MTIKEIAQLAQVSSAAVSRYLNGGYVSEEKRERIKRAIEETGYRPSAQARNLRMKKARLIGVVAPKLSSESVARMIEGIGKVLDEKQFHMLLSVTDNQQGKELEVMQFFENYPVDGIIHIGTTISGKHEKFFEQSQVPVVVIDQYTEKTSCVYHDDYGAAKALAERIAGKAKSKIAYVGVRREVSTAGQEREKGFRAGLKEAGIELKDELYRISECSVEAAYEQAKDLMEKENDIDVIACATDMIAAGVLEAVREGTTEESKRVKVAGFGDNPFLIAASNEFTTVHLYYKTSGIKAAEMLLDIIEKGYHVPMQIKLGFYIREF